MGIWGALTGVASVAGVILGGVLTDGPGWRWIFFINVPVAAIAVATVARVLPESLAAGLINTSQEVGGALGVAAAATFAFRRVSYLTAAAHGDPHLIQAARTTVFHVGFAAGVTFAVIALMISVIFLARIPQAGVPAAA